jgi:hypothetical protein
MHCSAPPFATVAPRHGKQFLAPVPDEYVPTGQDGQLDPLNANTLLAVPSRHAVHVVLLDWKVPLLQPVQMLAPSDETYPGAQGSHVHETLDANVPARQRVHDDAFPDDTNPARHGFGEVEPAEQLLPAGQSWITAGDGQ